MKLIRQAWEDEWLVSEIELDGTNAFRFYKNDSEGSSIFLTNEPPENVEWIEKFEDIDTSFISLKPHSGQYRPAMEILEEYIEKGEVDIL